MQETQYRLCLFTTKFHSSMPAAGRVFLSTTKDPVAEHYYRAVYTAGNHTHRRKTSTVEIRQHMDKIRHPNAVDEYLTKNATATELIPKLRHRIYGADFWHIAYNNTIASKAVQSYLISFCQHIIIYFVVQLKNIHNRRTYANKQSSANGWWWSCSNTELSKYQPYTSYVIPTPNTVLTQIIHCFFLLKQVDINADKRL